MLLTDRQIRETAPGAKPIKLNDGDGLYLLVQPNGALVAHAVLCARR